MGKRIVTFIVTSILTFSVAAQELSTLQETFTEAEYFFVIGEYPDALPYYLQLYEKLPENANIAYRIGVCCLNIDGKKNLSTDYLEAAVRNMSAKHREGTINQIAPP